MTRRRTNEEWLAAYPGASADNDAILRWASEQPDQGELDVVQRRDSDGNIQYRRQDDALAENGTARAVLEGDEDNCGFSPEELGSHVTLSDALKIIDANIVSIAAAVREHVAKLIDDSALEQRLGELGDRISPLGDRVDELGAAVEYLSARLSEVEADGALSDRGAERASE